MQGMCVHSLRQNVNGYVSDTFEVGILEVPRNYDTDEDEDEPDTRTSRELSYNLY